MGLAPRRSMVGDLDELEFLSNAALALDEIGPEEDIYRFVVERLAVLAPDTLVVATSYDPISESSTVRAIAGLDDMRRRADAAAGEAPLGLVFRMDEDVRRMLSEGKLLRVPDGMHQVTSRVWSVEKARRFEAATGIRSVYGQPFSRRGDFLGAVVFLSRSASLEHPRVIEAFVRLAAVAIRRRRAETGLRDSEARFRRLAENSQDAIFRLRTGESPAFEYVSPATAWLTGRTVEELYADPQLGSPCLCPEAWTKGGAIPELPDEPVVAQCRRPDGSTIWAEQKFTPIRDARGNIIAIEGIARDITKRKEAEGALIDADRRKTQFLAVLSHELRNPLGSIKSALYVLDRTPPGSEQAARARAVMERQITHLTRLIDDLLDVTRITRGKIRLQRERIDLNELVRSTVEDRRSAFASSGVELEVLAAPSAVGIRADRTRVAQVIDNLLQNAAKFTPPGGRASISVRADPATGDAVLRVRNTGARIPPDVLSHIFEPFVQADRTLDRSKGGLGLGLALVKGLVDIHGGSVNVESGGAEGTTFTVRLPLDAGAPEVARADRPIEAVAPEASHHRVLLIEDNEDAADSLRAALELHANTVAVARTGPDGIAAARAFKPDVVVCDIGLPAMSGYEVARAIRGDPELKKLSLVALTGYASPDDVERSREAGFDRHLAKPPSIEALERIVTELAGRADVVRPARAGDRARGASRSRRARG